MTHEQEVEQEEGGMHDLDTQQQQQQMTDSGSEQQQELEDNNAASGNTRTNTADNDERYMGMISSKADRANLADCLHKKAPKKRKKGSFCPHPKLAADSFMMKKLHNAFKAVANAADAMYCPENTNGLKHRVVLLSLCEVEETDVDGGSIAMYHHTKPKISLVACSKEDAKAVHQAYCNAFKHRKVSHLKSLFCMQRIHPKSFHQWLISM